MPDFTVLASITVPDVTDAADAAKRFIGDALDIAGDGCLRVDLFDQATGDHAGTFDLDLRGLGFQPGGLRSVDVAAVDAMPTTGQPG